MSAERLVDEIQIHSERQAMVLSAADLEEASLALSKQAQIESFKDDYKDLQANRALSSDSSHFHCNQPSLLELSDLEVG